MDKLTRRATKIMLIRHAEKPLHAAPVRGVTPDGTRNKESLIVRGWQRAGALTGFFAPSNNLFQEDSLARPQFLYAAKPLRHHGSRRALETLTPLAEKLAIEINSGFPKFAVEALTAAAVNCDGVVLICWNHENLPHIANHILGDDTTAPQVWSANRFDMVWVFDREFGSKRYNFKQVPQNLLNGDLPVPIT